MLYICIVNSDQILDEQKIKKFFQLQQSWFAEAVVPSYSFIYFTYSTVLNLT